MLKKPSTLDEQINIMRAHGISVNDVDKAKEILSRISYYRLSGYALQFRINSSDSNCKPGTDFDDVYTAYCFDEQLRNILRPFLEKAEIFYKNQISYGFSLAKCMNPPHDQHYDRNNYFNKQGFDSIMNDFQNKGANYYHDSPIMKHHNAKYQGKMPFWVLLELLSFSNASMLYNAMYFSEKDAIANAIGVSNKTLSNHLHCLSVLRNKCAHGARLYNTELRPSASFNAAFLRKHPEITAGNTVFAYVLVLLRRLPTSDQKQHFCFAIVDLIENHAGKIELERIGFPDNYKEILQNSIR